MSVVLTVQSALKVSLLVLKHTQSSLYTSEVVQRLCLAKSRADTDRQTTQGYPAPVPTRYSASRASASSSGSFGQSSNRDIETTKSRIAKQVMGQFESFVGSIRDKKVLDVGFGLGYNSQAMKDAGATVYGVEPDTSAYSSAVNSGRISKENAIHGKMQDLPPEMKDQFDIASLMLWNICSNDRDAVMSGLAGSIKNDGMVVIGIHDENYISDSYAAVKPLVEKYFNKVYATPIDNSKYNRQLIICQSPKN